MRDIELYQQILGLEEPWSVQEVELNIDEGRVDIHAEHPAGVKWKCPHCERELSCYDHSAERTWRHLDTCQLKTHLHARIPRVKCEEHGVVQVAVPWAEEHGRFTLLMERMIIQALLACQTTKGACELMRISWDQAWHVTQRAVARGQARKEAVVIPQIGVDEKAFRKGHKYMTVVNDIQRATVEFVTEDREKASLERYFAGLTDEQRQGIEGVAIPARRDVGALCAGHAGSLAAGQGEDCVRPLSYHAAHDEGRGSGAERGTPQTFLGG